MKFALIAVSFTTLAIFAGCSSTPPQPAPSASTTTSNAPAWIDNPDLPDVYTGIGIAQPNPLGDKAMQRITAVSNARVDLAQKLKIRVQNLFTQLNQQATSAGGDGSGTVRNDVASRMTENTSRLVTDQELSNSIVKQTWTDPADGNLYALVTMSKAATDQDIAKIAKSQIKKEELASGDVSLQKALNRLDDTLTANTNANK